MVPLTLKFQALAAWAQDNLAQLRVDDEPPKAKKRALLIGVVQGRVRTSSGEGVAAVEGESTLKGPMKDVLSMRDLLMGTYDYHPNDIVVLLEDPSCPASSQPTRDNIIENIRWLVRDAAEGDKFFFHFSGHSDQKDTKDIDEEDRKNEFIITSDGYTILDNDLKRLLLHDLPPKSQLTAVFDTCHSGTILDLKHFRCNNVYLPWINKGERKTKTLWNIVKRKMADCETRRTLRNLSNDTEIPNVKVLRRDVQEYNVLRNGSIRCRENSVGQLKDASAHSRRPETRPVRFRTKTSITEKSELERRDTTWIFGATIQRCSSPENLYCDGVTCDEKERFATPKATVICLSAAEDAQLTWEFADGGAMTAVLVRILSEDPHPTLPVLLREISHALHERYIGLHEDTKEYRKKLERWNEQRRQKGRKSVPGVKGEMNNFQIPQMSSHRPLRRSHIFSP